MSSSSSPEAAASQQLPNWRVIPAHSSDYTAHLTDRPTWSDDQFHDSLQLYHSLLECEDDYVRPGILAALETLEHALRLYGPESVLCSFNGGKDAVVILHLVRAAHAHYYDSDKNKGSGEHSPIIRPRVVYFDNQDEFPQVSDFLRTCVDRYDLDMLAFEQGVKFQDGLKIVVDHNHLQPAGSASSSFKPFPMAFVLGTRSSDPNAGGQDHFAPSSDWMPPFMRVNPVLHWNYGHIWHFLRLFQLPYCSLYDEGYTSLGSIKDTLPCPALAVIAQTNGTSRVEGNQDDEEDGPNGNSTLPKFWPAYMLRDYDQERAGRIKKEKKPKKAPAETVHRCNSPTTSSTHAERATTTASNPSSVTGDDVSLERESLSIRTLGDDNSTVFTLDDAAQKSVGILIIGDEILKGLTVDQNTNAAAKALRKECVKLSRVVVVSDDMGEIKKEMARLQEEVDVIITSGGVGPTHDDVTIKSVASFLGRKLELNEEMAELLKKKMDNGNTPLTHAQVKMATLPSNAKLRYLSEQKDEWPVLQCRNIFVLPGVPEFFSQKIENLATYLSTQLERGTAYKVVLSVDEAAIVDILNESVLQHPKVSFGSYPFVSHPEFKTVLTLEGALVEAGGDGTSFSTIPGRQSSSTGMAAFRNSVVFDTETIPTKDLRDRHVRLALDDLINQLPDGSILRVENDDLTPFT